MEQETETTSPQTSDRSAEITRLTNALNLAMAELWCWRYHQHLFDSRGHVACTAEEWRAYKEPRDRTWAELQVARTKVDLDALCVEMLRRKRLDRAKEDRKP